MILNTHGLLAACRQESGGGDKAAGLCRGLPARDPKAGRLRHSAAKTAATQLPAGLRLPPSGNTKSPILTRMTALVPLHRGPGVLLVVGVLCGCREPQRGATAGRPQPPAKGAISKEIEMVNLPLPPMSTFEEACTRCRGPQGSFYGAEFAKLSDEELVRVTHEKNSGIPEVAHSLVRADAARRGACERIDLTAKESEFSARPEWVSYPLL